MLKIVAKSVLKKGEKENFLQSVKELIEKSRQESGCISYSLFEDINDDSVLTFIEEWKDIKAIEEHNNSEHFKTLFLPLEQFCIGKSEINVYKEV